MKLVSISEVSNHEIKLFQKEFKQNKEIMHGSNELMRATDMNSWRKYILQLESKAPKNRAKTKQFFICDDTGYLVGVIDFRLNLLPYQELDGGHIGYSIRKSRRGEGHGTYALKKVIEFVRKETYLSYLLLTCEEGNHASKKIITKCGGEFKDSVFVNRKWIEHYIIYI